MLDKYRQSAVTSYPGYKYSRNYWHRRTYPENSWLTWTCMQTAPWQCSSKHLTSWSLHTHKHRYLRMLAITGKSSTWKCVNILIKYMFSFQRLRNYFEYRHSIHPKRNSLSGYKSGYSLEVLYLQRENGLKVSWNWDILIWKKVLKSMSYTCTDHNLCWSEKGQSPHSWFSNDRT